MTVLSVSLLLLSLSASISSTDAKPTRTSRRGQGLVVSLARKGIAEAREVHGSNIGALIAERDHLAAKYAGTKLAYERNTGEALPWAKNETVDKRATTATLILDNRNSPFSWSGTVTVGTNPAQSFLLDFDTGSADFWSTAYTPGGSAVNTGNPFVETYGGGTHASGGYTYKDTMTIAGLTATNQYISTAPSVQGGLPNYATGLAGMAYQTISNSGGVPFVLNLKSQGVIQNAVFGFRLGLHSPELYIGGTDTTQLATPLTYTPVVNQGYWQIALGGATVGATTIFGPGDAYRAIVDTGATAIQGPPAIVATFYATFPQAMTYNALMGTTDPANNGYYVAPCNYGNNFGTSTTYYPSRSTQITFTIGGTTYVLPYQALVATGPVGNPVNGVQYCSCSVVGSTLNNDDHLWIIGDAFLLATYVELDFDQNRVGFAYSTGS